MGCKLSSRWLPDAALLLLLARASDPLGLGAQVLYLSGVLASFLLYIMMNGTRDLEHYWFRCDTRAWAVVS